MASAWTARMTQWWAGWWDADYSWDGLAKKDWSGWVRPLDGGPCVEAMTSAEGRAATLQDYFIDRLGPDVELIPSPDGTKRFTELHLPLHWRDGAPTGKGDWPEEALDDDLRTLLTQAGPRTDKDEAAHNPPDRRAQCDGVVFLDFDATRTNELPAPAQDDRTPLALSCRNAAFSGDASFDSAAFSGNARFDNAAFSGDAWFDNAAFSGNAWFDNAAFSGDAWFDNAAFSGNARFYNAAFSGDARFNNAAFSGYASFDNAAFSGNAWFHNAAFSGHARFYNAAFSGDASFDNAAFSGDASFDSAAFSDEASFYSAAFSGYASFDNAAFSGDASFDNAAFSGDARFYNAAFSGNARFDNAAFSGNAWFSNAAFSGDASFDSAAFSGNARFYNAAFSGDAWFDNAAFSGYASFDNAAFSGDARFNNAAFSGDAWFDNAAFSGDASFDNAAFCGALALEGCHFEGGASFTGRALAMSRPAEAQALDLSVAATDATRQGLTGQLTLARQILPSAYRSVDRVWARNAVFVGDVDFGNRDIVSESSFAGATFLGLAKFHGARLHQWVNLPKEAFRALDYALVKPGQSRVGSWRRGGIDPKTNERKPDVPAGPCPPASLTLLAAQRRAAGLPRLANLNDTDWTTAVQAWTAEVQQSRARRAVAADDGRYIQIEACFRTLKQAMEDSRARLAESDFFKLELKARRKRRDRDVWEKAFSDLYGAMSDYGASAFRPMIWLAGALVVFAVLYWMGVWAGQGFRLTPPADFRPGQPWIDTGVWEALRYSASRMLPFGALSEDDWPWRARLLSDSWGGGTARVLATVQSLLAAVLTFQIALAVRRRFQIT